MSLIELIGFVITMVMMILLFGKRVREERRRSKHPHEFEDEEGLPPSDPMKQFLRALSSDHEDDDEEEEESRLQQRSSKKHKLKPKLADYHQESSVGSRTSVSNLDKRYTDHAYEVHKTIKTSYGSKVLGRLKNRRDMMICHEIFTKPKGW